MLWGDIVVPQTVLIYMTLTQGEILPFETITVNSSRRFPSPSQFKKVYRLLQQVNDAKF